MFKNGKGKIFETLRFLLIILGLIAITYFSVLWRIHADNMSFLEAFKNIHIMDLRPLLFCVLVLIPYIFVNNNKLSHTKMALFFKDRFHKAKLNNVTKYRFALEKCKTNPDLKSIIRICHNEFSNFTVFAWTVPIMIFSWIVLSLSHPMFERGTSYVSQTVIGCVSLILFLILSFFFKKRFETHKMIWLVLYYIIILTLIIGQIGKLLFF